MKRTAKQRLIASLRRRANHWRHVQQRLEAESAATAAMTAWGLEEAISIVERWKP